MKGLSGPVVEGKKRRRKKYECVCGWEMELTFLRMLRRSFWDCSLNLQQKEELKKKMDDEIDIRGHWIESNDSINLCMYGWMNEWGAFIVVPERWEIEGRVVQVWNLSHIQQQDLNTTLNCWSCPKAFFLFSLFLCSLYAVGEILAGRLEKKLGNHNS